MKKLLHTIKLFTAYVSQEITEGELQDHMHFYGENISLRTSDFHHTIIDKHTDLVAAVKILLTRLRIPHNHWGHYLGRHYSFYDILIEIKKLHMRNTDLEIDLFIELIEKKDRFLTRPFVLNLILLLIALTVFIIFFPPALMIFKYFIDPAAGLPYFGLLITSISSSFSFASNYYERKKTLFESLRDGVFLMSNFILNTSAYALWIIAAAPMAPLSVGLFVAASSVNVVRELFYASQMYISYKQHPSMSTIYSLDERKITTRLQFGYLRHRNAAAINFVGSLILLGLMTAWCLAPGGAAVVVGIVAAIVVVHIIRSQLNKWNDARSRRLLANELIRQEEEYNSEMLVPDTKPRVQVLKSKEKPVILHEENKTSCFGFFASSKQEHKDSVAESEPAFVPKLF